MERFDINKYVVETLKDLGIPVFFAARKEVKPPLVVFNNTGERRQASWDDKESMTRYRVSLNLFANDNFTEYKEKIIDLMLKAGFVRTDIPACEYYEDIELYMQPMFFFYIKENF